MASTPIHPRSGRSPAKDSIAATGSPETAPAGAPASISAGVSASGPAKTSDSTSPNISTSAAAAPPAAAAAAPPAATLTAAPDDRLVAKRAAASTGNHPVLWTALVFAVVICTLAFLWGSRPPVPDSPNPGAPDDALVDARSEILAIERLLDTLAFPPGKVDGVANAETEAAIRDYQRAAGLPVDGYATPALLEELRAVAGTD